MRLSKRQIKGINLFLQNKPGYEKEFITSASKNFFDNMNQNEKEFIPLTTKKFFDNMSQREKENIEKVSKLESMISTGHIKKHHRIVSSYIILEVLRSLPIIDREQTDKLFHYTCSQELILKNGLRASNFLNNTNDRHEVVYLLDKLGLSSSSYIRIYEIATLSRYNSFSYVPIDKFALKKYINKCCECSKGKNKLITNVQNFENDGLSSKASMSLVHGYIRYDIFGKKDAITLLGDYMSALWPHGVHPMFIHQLISILASFVKRKQNYTGNHCYANEYEYRFLYLNIAKKGIPDHFVPLTKEDWKCAESSIYQENKCKI